MTKDYKISKSNYNLEVIFLSSFLLKTIVNISLIINYESIID